MVDDKEQLDKAGSVLDQVSYKETLDKITAENRKAQDLVDELSKLKAEQAMAGKSVMGGKKEMREMTPQEYAKQFMKGKVNLRDPVPQVSA